MASRVYLGDGWRGTWGRHWWSSPLAAVMLATGIKLLLIPSYRSTDFEVHRNWLAVTSSLPLSHWYYEDTSEWTLDYPPLFAWFEWCLSRFAPLFDPGMLSVVKDQYATASAGTVLYQRLTVIASDLVLFGGIAAVCRTWPRSATTETEWSREKRALVFMLAAWNPGLLMVDHVHFQYNGFLLGMLLCSVALIRSNRDVAGAAVFAALLCFKHIFLYIAPVYFVYLFRHYCCQPAPAAARRSSRPETFRDTGGGDSGEGNDDDDDDDDDDDEGGGGDGGGGAKGNGNRPSTSGRSSPLGSLGAFGGGGSRYRTASEEDEFLDTQRTEFSLGRFVLLGVTVLGIAALAFAPFLLATPPAEAVAAAIKEATAGESGGGGGGGDGGRSDNDVVASVAPSSLTLVQRVLINGRQIMSRLFPFKRGLSHAYWAPNVWALYNFADKVLLMLPPLRRKFGAAGAALTGGLVEDASTAVLPAIRPGHTFILVLLSMAPSLISLWRRPHPKAFVHAIVTCSLCSFMLGWHVHEKAILISLIPLSLMAADNAKDARLFVVMSWTSHVSLGPLLFEVREEPVKVLLILLYGIATHAALSRYHRHAQNKRHIRAYGVQLSGLEMLYVLGLGAVYSFGAVIHPVLFTRTDPATGLATLRMPFLPLMLTSVYCAVGLIYCWARAHESLHRRIAIISTYLPSPMLAPEPAPGQPGSGSGGLGNRPPERESPGALFSKPALRGHIDDFLLS